MNGLATSAWPLDRHDWLEQAPMVRRIARIAATAPIRLIDSPDGPRTVLARLPSGALVARSVDHADRPGHGVDVTALAGELGRWLDTDPRGIAANGHADGKPTRADASWRGGRPPQGGWHRIERVPAAVVRDLVRAGAQAHVAAADQGLGARAVDTLLDRAVLTVSEARARPRSATAA